MIKFGLYGLISIYTTVLMCECFFNCFELFMKFKIIPFYLYRLDVWGNFCMKNI